jgi:YHS domain-containing protein
VAIQGYDPVAYFKQGKALKGRKEIAATYEGVVYYFRCQVIKNIS